PGAGGALAYAARAADALSGQAVGRVFFREFKTTLDRMTDGLPRTLHSEDRRSLALLQLTRVLFLYFIQAKGWLAGRDRFLADEVDRCLRRSRRIHRDLLRPLFFGTLNRPAAERSRCAAAFGAVPFLNGGLFEPHPLERRLRGDIPNTVWRDAFDHLFERFHFVVSEHGTGGGIAPDMLGRVFEGVMAPDVRRASGTYYTPAALVRAVLDAALTALVAGRTGCSEAEAERRLHERQPTLGTLLAGIALLDPAAGSGAFLLGALERLSALTASHGVPGAADRRRVLQRNLFGVDRSAAAVRLTELRLWLAVIADDREDRPERVEPLPNLDCLVRQGDSLLEPIGGVVRLRAAEPRLAAAVAGLRRQLVSATGGSKRELVRELRAAECRTADASLGAGEAEARSRIDECLLAARSADLFGERRGADRGIRTELTGLRGELRALRAARRTLAREREVPWFHYQSHFADVFAAGGFDVVAGNPPWLRAEEIPADTRRRLEGRYRWWRGPGAGFSNRPDLAVAFIERAVELAAPGGVVALLVPNKLMTAGYGAAARHALAASTTLTHVADLTGQPGAAFDATVYPLALVTRKSPPPPGHRVRATLGRAAPATVPQGRLRGGGAWILSSDRCRAIAARLARDHPTFGERLTCHLGVKTGANRLFLDPPEDIEAELLRWAIRGRDLRAYVTRPRVRILWTHGADGAPLARLPPRAAAHLAPHDAALRARTDYAGGAVWTLFRARAATSAYRVVWSDLARRLTACALTGRRDANRIPLNTCYVASARSAEEAERLAAWLNSSWIRAVARLGAVPAAGGFHRYTAAVVSRLPLPAAVSSDAELSAIARAGRNGNEVQEALDDIAAGHLGLSASDRAALGRLVAESAADRR
ncbi:MAG: Eco57I restriction-modification methylase domain-containing protein, partial [Gemmatimonadota bacterium]|nr:Eco57I restriction-modification methylase domain-containing protein [Gemmatimonadota bacterium]